MLPCLLSLTLVLNARQERDVPLLECVSVNRRAYICCDVSDLAQIARGAAADLKFIGHSQSASRQALQMVENITKIFSAATVELKRQKDGVLTEKLTQYQTLLDDTS